jgi:hypothetical protein
MWADIGIAALLLAGVYCLLGLAGFRARILTSKSDRGAEDLYGRYADSPRARRRHPRRRGERGTSLAQRPVSALTSVRPVWVVGHRAESVNLSLAGGVMHNRSNQLISLASPLADP